jgi:hypothetical protein
LRVLAELESSVGTSVPNIEVKETPTLKDFDKNG